jgi:hypothetical protein
MFDLDARFAQARDRGRDRHPVAETVGHAENGAGFDDRMADEFEGSQIVEFIHADRGFHHLRRRGVEHREIARIEHDARGVAVAPFDAQMPGVAEHYCLVLRNSLKRKKMPLRRYLGAMRSAPSRRTTSPLR